MNSKRKGKTGELELAEELRRHGLTARRGQQFSGANGDADVVVEQWPRIQVECKRMERLNLDTAMEQAIRDGTDKTPVVMHRRNRGRWLATMTLDDFVKLATPAA